MGSFTSPLRAPLSTEAAQSPLGDMVGVGDANSRKLSRAELELLSDRSVRQHLPLLGALVPLGLPENAATSALSTAERADATVKLLVKLLTARLSGGLRCCIAIDGGESIHPASYRLLARLLREVIAVAK